MRARSPLFAAVCLAAAVLPPPAARITWDDVAPLRDRLQAHGVTAGTFAARVDRIRASNARRVREGDLDHLVFYLLQSTRFTPAPPIEPALSAKAVVEALEPAERSALRHDPASLAAIVPASVRARIRALLRAVDAGDRDPRLAYFRALLHEAFPDRPRRETALAAEYFRVMDFLYAKEFAARRAERASEAAADLYRTRGLSTDTAVEAGFLVSQALGVAASLAPGWRVRRALIVGPGLDLAPRTGHVEAGPPASYQPWAVLDALIALGLSRTDRLELVAIDINPRVVEHLRAVRTQPPVLTLVSGLAEAAGVSFSNEYREYFERLGEAIGRVDAERPPIPHHLAKRVRIHDDAARTVQAESLDVVTERLRAPAFDLIVATNVLTYFDDVESMLALTNVARMLAPHGAFLHNEARAAVLSTCAALGLPAEQSRHAVVATVTGAAPLGDSVWLHRRVPQSAR